MLTDASLQFSTLQAITATAVSTNVADLGVAEDLGIGTPGLKFAIYVGTAFTTTNAATLTVQFQGSTDNSTFTTYLETNAIAVAALVANAKIPLNWGHRNTGAALGRYVRLNYVVGTGVFSAGTLSALAVIDRDDWSEGLYPNGYTVGA